MIRKFIMLAGFAIAVTSFVFQYIKDFKILIIVFILVYLVLWLLLGLEDWMRNAKKDFFNKYFYIFSKNSEDYIIEYTESHYEYINKQEMKFSKYIEIRACTNNVKIYKDNFCWSSHSNSITIKPKYDDQKINVLASKNLWDIFEIDLGQRYKKKEIAKTGFDVINLKDDQGIAKPFLSHRSDKKVKERLMVVSIPKDLKPTNAKFEIYKTSETGKIIKSEPLAYDESINGFSKQIYYPRRGWTYAIVWDWE